LTVYLKRYEAENTAGSQL